MIRVEIRILPSSRDDFQHPQKRITVYLFGMPIYKSNTEIIGQSNSPR